MADYADRSLRIGYVGGSILLFTLLMIALGMWRISVGSVSFNNIVSPKVEIFYWVTILFSNTLGTALGDYFAADSGLGYEGAAVVFAGALVLLAVAYFYTKISRTLLFWSAFILTRPLGAALGDLLTKPVATGGFNLSRISSSLIIAVSIILFILFTRHRAGDHPGRGDQYQVIVQISPKYRGSFDTLAFGEAKPHSGSLKDGRLDLVYHQNPGLNIGDSFPLWTLH